MADGGAEALTPSLFTLGEALAVLLVADGRPLARAEHFVRTVAGSESNVAAALVTLGHPARFVTALGSDRLGDAVAATLQGWGIDVRAARTASPTGVLIRGLATDGPAEAVHLRAGSAATRIVPEQVDAAWDPATRAVFVTGITAVRSPSARAAVERTVQLARAAGALVVADANLRPQVATRGEFTAALAGIRGQVDVAIGDEDELAVLADAPADRAVRTLLDAGCRLVVTKRGAEGAVAQDGTDRDGTEEYAAPTRAERIVDTVGAGDAFAAGLIAGLLEHRGVPAALELASVVAARIVGTVGDVAASRGDGTDAAAEGVR